MSITTSYVDGQVLKAENVTEIVTKINANETSINGLSTTKVDKVTGKSLVSDTTIADLTDTTDTSLHYHSSDRNRSNHTGTQSASTITQDASNRLVTDAEKSTWNGKATQTDIDNSIDSIQNEIVAGRTSAITGKTSDTMGHRLDGIDVSLEEKTEQLTSKTNYLGGIVTFIDDDTHPTFWTKWKPVADANGIKISVAHNTAYTGDLGNRLTLPQLKQLKSEGYDILSHGNTHPNLDTITNAELESEWSLSKQFLIDNELGDDLAVVYPTGLLSVTTKQKIRDIKQITRKYFRYGIDANLVGAINQLPVDNYEVLRQVIAPSTVVLSEVKDLIDDCFTEGKWLIFLTHCGASWNDATTPANLTEIINYIKSKTLRILNFREAESLLGNVISHGDSRENNYNFVSKTGATWNSNGRVGNWIPILSGSSVAGNNIYSSQVGTYTKISDTIIARFEIAITSDGVDNLMSGNLSIKGLPFPSTLKINASKAMCEYNFLNLGTNFTTVLAGIVKGESCIRLYKQGNGVATNYLPVSNLDKTQVIIFNGTILYQVDTQ